MYAFLPFASVTVILTYVSFGFGLKEAEFKLSNPVLVKCALCRVAVLNVIESAAEVFTWTEPSSA